MKLNIGCGPKNLHKEGWINIDLIGEQYVNGDTQFLRHDLREGLPIKDFAGNLIKDVTHIYSSHAIEHFTNEQVKKLLKDCYKVMAPGAIISHCIPDFPSTFKAYVEKNKAYFSEVNKGWYGFPPQPHSDISYMEFSVYQGGEHVSLWDLEKAILYHEEAGFKAKARAFDESIDSACPVRTKYSFYIEAIKPN